MYEVLNYFLLNLCHRFKKVVQAHYCRLLNNHLWRISAKCNDSGCEWAFWASVWDQALWRAVTICKHLWCKRIVLWIWWDATLALTRSVWIPPCWKFHSDLIRVEAFWNNSDSATKQKTSKNHRADSREFQGKVFQSSLTSYITESPEKRWTEWWNAHHHWTVKYWTTTTCQTSVWQLRTLVGEQFYRATFQGLV